MLQHGIDSGEFRPVDVETAVHSLLLPMVMLCVDKHSLGACVPKDSLLRPEVFVHQHMALVIGGLLAHPQAHSAAHSRHPEHETAGSGRKRK